MQISMQPNVGFGHIWLPAPANNYLSSLSGHDFWMVCENRSYIITFAYPFSTMACYLCNVLLYKCAMI